MFAPQREAAVPYGAKKFDLCSANERGTSKLADARKSFTQRIERAQATSAECISHIVAETQLLIESKKAYDDQVVVDEADRNGLVVLNIIANRINRLYTNLFCLFPIEIALLQKFLFFHSNYKEFLTEDKNSLCSLMSQNHSNPEVYIVAAHFMFFSQSDILSARRYFSNGISYHVNYEPLYVEDFGVEVQQVEKTNGDSLPIALKKYKDYTEHFKGDMQFHFQLLDRALSENTVCELQYHMIRDMVVKYNQNETMWKKLATINYVGFIYDNSSGKLEYDTHGKRKLMASFNAYEDGLLANNCPEKQLILWKLYAEHIIEIWKHSGILNNTMEVFLTDNMKRVFQQAHNIGALPREYYVYWAEFSFDDCDQVVTDRAVEMNNDNPDIWIEVLKHYLKLGLFEMSYRVLYDSVRALEENSILLWKIMGQSLEKTKDKELIVDFYQRAIVFRFPEIRSEFMLQYLKWCHVTQGKSATRKLFKELKNCQPENPQLYRDMISYEKHHLPINSTFISKIYVDMSVKFSRSNIGMWMDGIRFNYAQNKFTEAQEIYNSASSVLNKDLMNDLNIQFEKLKVKVTYPSGVIILQ